MSNPGIGSNEHACACEPSTPAEIEVLRAGKRGGIESIELGEEIRPHEQRGARHVEDVAHGVVLLLVELPGFDAGVGTAEPVDGPADLEEDLGVVGVDELRADDAGVGAVRLFQHDADRTRVENDVIVTKEEKGGTLDRRQRLICRAREADALGQALHVRAGQHVGDARRRVVVGRHVDDEDREIRIVLGSQRPQRVVEPGLRIARHDNRGDRWSSGGEDFSEGLTLGENLVAGLQERWPVRGFRRVHQVAAAYQWGAS